MTFNIIKVIFFWDFSLLYKNFLPHILLYISSFPFPLILYFYHLIPLFLSSFPFPPIPYFYPLIHLLLSSFLFPPIPYFIPPSISSFYSYSLFLPPHSFPFLSLFLQFHIFTLSFTSSFSSNSFFLQFPFPPIPHFYSLLPFLSSFLIDVCPLRKRQREVNDPTPVFDHLF